MVKFLDSRERETEILDLLINSYVKESRPISSSYLCEKHNLSYSSATVRNIMLTLEKKGLLSHIHTSSGKVPTKEGFKYYVEHLKTDDVVQDIDINMDLYHCGSDITEIIDYFLNILSQNSGYTSLAAISNKNDTSEEERLFFRGTRFMLEQPEFEDINKLKSLFYALEVKINKIQELLFSYLDENIKILIGDDIGCEEISDCSLVVSGMKKDELCFALALLGPMRMDYVKAVSYIRSVRNCLQEVVEEFL